MKKYAPKNRLTLQTVILAIALVALGTLAGVLAGGAWLPLSGLSVGFTCLAFWAARQDWLEKTDEEPRLWQGLRVFYVIGGSILFALLYVGLTGGDNSPLSFALYLPLVLGAVCFGARAGMASGLAMALLYIASLCWREPRSLASPIDWEGALSFPLVAVAVSLLTKRNEERLLAVHRRTRDLDALLDISQMMDAAVDLEMMLSLLLLNVQKISGCQVCAIYLKDLAEESVDLRAVSAPRNHPALRPAFTLEEVQDRDLQALRLDPKAQHSMYLPLTCVEGMLGLLYLGDTSSRALRPAVVIRLEQLAEHAAFPLQRALTQQGFETLAYRDAMTGLDNFRQFERTLQDEMSRAKRYGRPLSLLLLDIDHFKSFNDTLGHPAGDLLLAQLGTVLRNTLRSVDHPARYGGEEFAVTCPETGSEEAALIAERIRRAVAETPFLLAGPGGQSHHVTVSVGYATCCQETCSPPVLIKQADHALYSAKRAGRNTIRPYREAQSIAA